MQATQHIYEALIKVGVKPEDARRVEQSFESDFKQVEDKIEVVKTQTQTVAQTVAQNDERQKAKTEYTTSQWFNELKLMRTEMNSEFKAIRAEMKADNAELKAELKAEMKAEISSVKNDLSKQIIDAQRWTITMMFAGLGALALLQKYL